ncbi:glycosyltransferase [Amphibacillus sp. Q70]|uniref:glycosyltransferase n=1 Tax=Amphibacillus sp. Q70 TaxID=3453416 RepID=UPI003F87F0C2
MPILSVIMPVYNASEYLAESIESILTQTFSQFDFYLIDDGSIDDSLDIIKKYQQKDHRIRIISRENKGVAYSLNEALALSNSTYIARMDADDISFANRFEEQISYLEDNPNIDVLGTKIVGIGDFNLSERNEVEKRYGIEIGSNQLLRDNLICHPSVMMRRSFINAMNGYSHQYQYAEDYDLWIRGVKGGFTLQNLQKELLQYRMHPSSIVSKNTENHHVLKDLINIRLDFFADMLFSKDFSYIIWGAGTGGQIALEILKRRFNNCHFIGFIDGYKQGNFLNNKVYSPEALKKLDFDYCFTATTPGKVLAEKSLVELGFEPFYDFFYLI